MTHDEMVATIVRALVDAFRPYGWNDGSLAAYVWALEDLTMEQLTGAAEDAVRTCERMPTPVQLRQLCLDRAGARLPDAGEAWAEVLHAAARIGRAGQPTWSSPVVAAALDAIGGYRWVCDSTTTVADRARFCDAYDRLAARAERAQLLHPALGIAALPLAQALRRLPGGGQSKPGDAQ